MSELTVAPIGKPTDPADVSLPQPNPLRISQSASAVSGWSAMTVDDKGFGFADLVDTLNPLQQLPLIGDLYRAVTGDEISQEARYAGSALYGMALDGPAGMGAFLCMAMVGDAVSDHFNSDIVQVATSGSSDVVEDPDAPIETQTVAEAVSGDPTDLFQWLCPEAAAARFPVQPAALTADGGEAGDLPPAMPAGVEGLTSDPNNHLPLSVLEALRQRHIGMLGDEQA
ncbi:hypothetical protein [Breoghania sp.]|uniref:hypothetical protein n=1 Tax=Breoghania sp. TaxID=2065378 RepID=UPI002605B004|nr:hypothetical protein [Breoghania sp.]MDJ0930634.1 hypothetical protein [Breoghania sp.]